MERVSTSERPVLPSELLARKQFFFPMRRREHDGAGTELRGDDCLLWASDFPHEATRTNLHDLVKEFFDRKDLPATAKNNSPAPTRHAFTRCERPLHLGISAIQQVRFLRP